MATYFGIVDADASVKMAGSGDWSAESRGTGLYTVTLNGASSAPIPLVSPCSDDLTEYSQGNRRFVNITDIGEDDNGRYYFGVAINTAAGQLNDKSWSFVAETAS